MGGWITLGMKLLPYIVEAVGWVEKFVTRKGKQKQDAAVYMVKSIVGVAEISGGRDLLDDEEVEDATRKVIDAVVALNNIVASKRSE